MPVCISAHTLQGFASRAGFDAQGIDPMPESQEADMDTQAVTHEIWIAVEDMTGELYGEALIGIAYTDENGHIHPKLAAMPTAGAKLTLRPVVQ
jgi:hypothetical protein